MVVQHLCKGRSRGTAAAVCVAGAFLRGACGNGMDLPAVPTGFIPQEDQGYLMVIVQAPPGSSLAYTTALADRAEGSIAQNPDMVGTFSMMGFSLAGGAANQGLMFVVTKPSDQRRGKGHSAAEIVPSLRQNLQMLLFAPQGGWWQRLSRRPCKAWAAMVDSSSCCRTRA